MHRTIASRTGLLLATSLLALLWLSALFVFLLLRPLAKPSAGAYPVQSEFSGLAGINLDASELAPARLAHTLTELEALNLHWVRFTLPWDAIEPARGQFDWATWDAVFAELAKHPTLTPVVALNGAPAWARAAADAGIPQAPPHERADFGAFAAAVAQRYGDRLRYYQVWHEPNIAPHWGARDVDPAGYVGLLREGAVQIRAADSDAQIVLAALAPTTEEGGANLSDITFLDALYGLGARSWFDLAAAQPYGFSEPPDAGARSRSAQLQPCGVVAPGDGAARRWRYAAVGDRLRLERATRGQIAMGQCRRVRPGGIRGPGPCQGARGLALAGTALLGCRLPRPPSG